MKVDGIEFEEKKIREVSARCQERRQVCHECTFGIKSLGGNMECFFAQTTPSEWGSKIMIME